MLIVTGGAGFIGSAVVWKLNQLGRDDIVVVDELGCDEKWKNLVSLRFADFWHKDEFRQRVESDTLGAVEAVVHLGAISSTTERNADLLMENNYRYTQRLAEWCVSHQVRLIYASSAATYGDGSLGYDDCDATSVRLRPLNAYGYSKQLFDLWALRTGVLRQIVGLKFFNVFGPNEYHKADMASVVFKSFHQIRSTGSVRLFKSTTPQFSDGGQMRDFVYVKDCVNVIAWLLDNRVSGIFNLGTGRARSWLDLVSAVFAAMNVPPSIEFVDMPEQLRGKYQNFTEARMHKLREAGCPVEFHALEESVRDYVERHLATEQPHLCSL